jgi:hypothetical protein
MTINLQNQHKMEQSLMTNENDKMVLQGKNTTADYSIAGVTGLLTAGPLGVIASLASIHVLAKSAGANQKWLIWALAGLIVAPMLTIGQILTIGSLTSYKPNNSQNQTQTDTYQEPAVDTPPIIREVPVYINPSVKTLTKEEERIKFNQEEITSFLKDATSYTQTNAFLNLPTHEVVTAATIVTKNPNSTVNLRSRPDTNSFKLILEPGDVVEVGFCENSGVFCAVKAYPLGLQNSVVAGWVHSDYLSY